MYLPTYNNVIICHFAGHRHRVKDRVLENKSKRTNRVTCKASPSEMSLTAICSKFHDLNESSIQIFTQKYMFPIADIDIGTYLK